MDEVFLHVFFSFSFFVVIVIDISDFDKCTKAPEPGFFGTGILGAFK